MPERLLTPSKITAWLDCAHYLSLRHQVEDGTATFARSHPGAFAHLLMRKGETHEQECLAAYRAERRSVFEVPKKRVGETHAEWVDRVGNPMADGHDVIFQMPFVHDRMRGIADFLVRVPGSGPPRYEPVDSKLARASAKPGHVLQLCFYAEAMEAITGHAPKQVHIWLGSNKVESVLLAKVRPYWNRLRLQFAALLDGEPATDTRPEPCAHCDFCEFQQVCDARWRAEDSLVYVAGVASKDRAVLEGDGVATRAALAALEGSRLEEVGLPLERLQRMVRQASLQVTAAADPEKLPPVERIEPVGDDAAGQGFALLPEADEGDVFLDFEGHPFFNAQHGLFFLLGYIARASDGTWAYTAIWAHGPDEEAKATERLIRDLAARRQDHPGMHVYHYNHTERSSLAKLANTHGVCEALLHSLVETGLFVDLLQVVRGGLVIGTESYGLKHVERLTGFARSHVIEKGSGAVLAYEAFMADRQERHLDEIAAYNEDDVRATRALRDWLLTLRPADLPWRPASLATDEDVGEVDERIARLNAFEATSPQHLLGNLLGYWARERRADLAPKLAKLGADPDSLRDDPEVIAGLVRDGLVPKTGRQKVDRMRFRFPVDQALNARKFRGRTSVIWDGGDGLLRGSTVAELRAEAGDVLLNWGAGPAELDVTPRVLVPHKQFNTAPKERAMEAFADAVLDGPEDALSRVRGALLKGEAPTFTDGGGPENGRFGTDLDAMLRHGCHLDASVLAVQGPPGTGKTWRGARMARSLLRAGKRVGVTALGHKAIENFTRALVAALRESGELELLRGARVTSNPRAEELPGVAILRKNAHAADPDLNYVAGTSWLFSSPEMIGAPVDVLFVDEAGQLALADALAAAASARNLVLLGDPLQLDQVTKATHPGRSGNSALGHYLQGHATMPPEQGIFLDETWRMHPDVCRFISDRIYEGRLRSHAHCARQDTDVGTGLRWLRVEHEGRKTESPEEVEAVHEAVSELVGQTWTDMDGERLPLRSEDILVVAPFNDQVQCLSNRLGADPRTAGVHVGTVDKFQGREAPVVFYTMTTSSAADMTRGVAFLFSQSRLNVAISRARCLAVLVCSEELLDARARTVEEMVWIGGVCGFVEVVGV